MGLKFLVLCEGFDDEWELFHFGDNRRQAERAYVKAPKPKFLMEVENGGMAYHLVHRDPFDFNPSATTRKNSNRTR